MSYQPFFKRAARALALVAVMIPATSMAQPSPAEVRAQARFKAGQDLFNKGDFEGARLEFQQAQAIYPRPSLLRSLAACELHMGRALEALKHLQEFMGDPNLPEDQRAQAEPNFAKAYAATGHVAITAPRGAQLKLDGTDVGIAPLRDAVDVVVGTHAVDAALGDAVAHASVQAEGGKVVAVTLTMAGVPSGPAVIVPTGPGVTPGPGPVGPGPGEHEGYMTTRRWVGVVIAGVGVVGLVLGGVFGAERGSETSDANAARERALATTGGGLPTQTCFSPSAASTSACSSLSSALQSNGTDAHLEELFLISGGMLLAVGAVTTLWPSFSPPAGTSLAPSAGPHMAGLQWSGSF